MAVNLSRQATGWTELRPYLPSRARLRMALIGLTAFLGSLSESLTLVLVTLTADSLIRTVEVVELGPLELTRTQAVLLATAMVLVRVSMTTLSAALSARFSSLAMRNAQSRLVRAYLEGSHVARSARQVGDLSAVAVTNGRFTADMANSYTLVAAGVCGLLAFGGTSLVVSPLATLAISVLGGLLLVVLRPLRTRSKRASKRLAETNRGLATSITETETLHREIEVFDAGDAVQEQLRLTIGENAERYERVRFLAAAVPQVFQASMLGAAVLSLLVVVRNPEAVDLASIGAVVLLLIRSMSAAQQLVMANQKVIEFGAYVHSLAELVDVLEASRPVAGEARPEPMVPLRLDRVSFTYDGESNVLEDLDLTLSAGDLVGVVGPSGAGKSTFVELLLRLRRPTAGTVQFGGVDAVDVERGHYAGKVAFVPQHPAVIRGTVAENVAFHRDIDEDRIRTALRLAHLEREVDALPEGIHTRLGPDDRALSGGQRQRLTIARAVAGDPEVVVLDEPTSALDAVSEEAIRELLDELRQDRVVIVVAHRYSTLRSCSRILVLQDGRLQMDADPAEVARHSEFFQTMVGDGAAAAGDEVVR